MQNKLLKPLLAEFLGTFTLVFVGALAVSVTPAMGTGLLVASLSHGLILIGLIYAYGNISGAHFNPAVTVALLVGSKIEPIRAALYIAVQFIGGIVAAYLMLGLIPEAAQIPANVDSTFWNYGQTRGSMTTTGSLWLAAAFEGVMVFLLATAIYQAAVYNRAGNLAGGVYTGASINPARTLGPALIAESYNYLLPYMVGLFGGGVVAGLVNGYVLTPDEPAQ